MLFCRHNLYRLTAMRRAGRLLMEELRAADRFIAVVAQESYRFLSK
ncbi:MAG: hypothetical protein K0R28_2732 [Paenibacillus sp.]|jgi:hypothetical protein|nr:hypothetical protein [Paenibacillus sp.]